MSEWSNQEIVRSLTGVTDSLEKLTATVNSFRDNHPNWADLDMKLEPVKIQALENTQRIQQLEDSQKWIVRLVIGAVILALLGLIFVV